MTSQSLSWRHQVRHDVTKCVMASKTYHYVKRFVMTSQVCHEVKICHDVKKCVIKSKIRHNVKQFVMKTKTRHDIKKFIHHSAKTFVKSKICHVINKSWCYKVRHDVNIRHDDKRFVMIQKVRHDVKKVSWCQNVCYDVKKFVMKSKHVLTWKSKKYVNILWWSQKHFMTSKYSLWRQKDVMTSIRSSWCQNISWRQIVRYDIKKVCHDVKNMLWWHKVRHCLKMFIMTRHDVKRFVMTSKVCHEVKGCHEVKICYDVNDIKNVSWRKENIMTLKSSS